MRGEGAWRRCHLKKHLFIVAEHVFISCPHRLWLRAEPGSVAVIREVGRECALRHRELLCSDTLSPCEPSEELAMRSFRTHTLGY